MQNNLGFRAIKFNPHIYPMGTRKFTVARTCEKTSDKISKALFEGELSKTLEKSPLKGDVEVMNASIIEKTKALKMKLRIAGHKGSEFYREIKTPVDLNAERDKMLLVDKLEKKLQIGLMIKRFVNRYGDF